MANSPFIKKIIPVTGIFILLITMAACAVVKRENRFIPDVWPSDRDEIKRDYLISNAPLVMLSSSCGDEHAAFFGPYIFVPLPIVPNPLWPFYYFGNKWGKADIDLTIEAPRKKEIWDSITVSLLLNGKPLASSEKSEDRGVWIDKRQYRYRTALTCGELEDSDITVHIAGALGTIDSKLFYTYRWKIYH